MLLILLGNTVHRRRARRRTSRRVPRTSRGWTTDLRKPGALQTFRRKITIFTKNKSTIFPFLFFAFFLALALGILGIAREFDHNSGNMGKNDLGFYPKKNRVARAMRCVRTIPAPKRPTFPKMAKSLKIDVRGGMHTQKIAHFQHPQRSAKSSQPSLHRAIGDFAGLGPGR